MKKTIIRSCIIMGAATVVMAVLLLLYLRGAGSLPGAEAVVPADGVYTASAEGYYPGEDLTVTLTFAEGKLTDVAIDASNETPEVGGKAAEALQEAILAAGGTSGVDGVSGATYTSDAVLAAANDCIAQARN